MTFGPVPHQFPFRFADAVVSVEGRAEGRVRALVTADADASRGGPLAASLFAELIAQSALLLEGGDPGLGRRGFLAGISDLAVTRAAVPGDVLEVTVSMAGRLGDTVKFAGIVTAGRGEEIARGSVVVRKGAAA